MLFACLLLFATSCKKKVLYDDADRKATEAQLFNLADVQDADIIEVANQIKKQGKEKNYLQYFLANNGTPVWSKSIKTGDHQQFIAIIPFLKDKSKEVDGFIVATKHNDADFSFSLFRKDFLKKYGFSNFTRFNASRVQVVLNYFDQAMFNKTTFRLQYAMQLPLDIRRKHPNSINPAFLLGHIKSISSNGSNAGYRTLSSYCFTITEEVDWWHDPDGTSDPCHCSGNEYYSYTTMEVMTVCIDTGGGGYVDNDGWWIGEPTLSGGGGSGGGGPYYTTEQKLNDLLGLGDSYFFVNDDPNVPQYPWDEEPVQYVTVEAFEEAIKDYKLETSIHLDQGSEKVLNARINRVFIGGYDIKVKIKQNSSNIFQVESVTSEEWGTTLGWAWTQTQSTTNVSGDIITVDVWGYEKYNIFVEGIGTVYKKQQHYQIKINKLTGAMISLARV